MSNIVKIFRAGLVFAGIVFLAGFYTKLYQGLQPTARNSFANSGGVQASSLPTAVRDKAISDVQNMCAKERWTCKEIQITCSKAQPVDRADRLNGIQEIWSVVVNYLVRYDYIGGRQATNPSWGESSKNVTYFIKEGQVNKFDLRNPTCR